MTYSKCILIPMRGGSKGISRKNLVEFEGRPLLHHILETSVNSCIPIEDIWVSTDDQEIKEESLKFGINVLDRPSDLAQDTSADLEVIQHFLGITDCEYDYIIHLRSTYPRMTTAIISDAVEYFEKNYDRCSAMRSMVSATEIPYKMWIYKHRGAYHIKPVTGDHISTSMPRQALPQAFYQNAAIDMVKVQTIIKEQSMVGSLPIPYIMDGMVEDGVDIDTPEDLRS